MRKQSIHALLLWASAIASPQVAAAEYDHLAFLSGCWANTSEGVEIQEQWGTERGGAMLGTSKTSKAGQIIAFEFLRIVKTEAGATYIPYINGKEASHFKLTTSAADLAVFENRVNDFPKLIEYKVDGHTLNIKLSGDREKVTYTLMNTLCAN